MIRIIHSIQNGNFADLAIHCEWANGAKWLVVNGKHRNNTNPNVIPVNENEFLSSGSTASNHLRKADVWIVHRYYPTMAPAILNFKRQGKSVIIQTWGKDYLAYNLHNRILLPTTQTIVHDDMGWNRNVGMQQTQLQEFRKPLQQKQWLGLFRKTHNNIDITKRVFESVDCVMFCQSSESLDFTNSYNHGGIARFIYKKSENYNSAENNDIQQILLNHTSNESMNHFDAIDALANYQQPKRIVIPLSYGSKKNVQPILTYAKKKLTCEIQTLTSWLSFNDYIRTTSSCGIFIHYGLRQQALGNLVDMIRQGKHIWCHSSGHAAKWLKQIGIKHLNEGDSYPEQSMSTKETELNVYLLNEYVEKINFARRERLTSVIGEET